MEGAVFIVAATVLWLGFGWLNDRDDARLDRLRETAVEACTDRTEGVDALGDCVTATIKATGQPT